MKFSNFLKFQKPLLCLLLALAPSPVLRAQAFAQGNVLNYTPPRKVVAKPGAAVLANVKAGARTAPLLGLEPRFDLPAADRLILASAKEAR